LAGSWDVRANADRLVAKLATDLPGFGVVLGESILDVGCGTGNLTGFLVGLTGDAGRVVAIDLSLEMIRRAREKHPSRRISWAECDAVRSPFSNGAFDRVFCHAVWPHLPDPTAAAREVYRLLRKGGRLHIWHSIPREAVNQIHRSSGQAVQGDLLEPAAAVARLLESSGFEIAERYDDENGYLVSGVKTGD